MLKRSSASALQNSSFSQKVMQFAQGPRLAHNITSVGKRKARVAFVSDILGWDGGESAAPPHSQAATQRNGQGYRERFARVF